MPDPPLSFGSRLLEGGQGGNRTPDAQIFSLPLYRLSYLAGNAHEFRAAEVLQAGAGCQCPKIILTKCVNCDIWCDLILKIITRPLDFLRRPQHDAIQARR